MSKNKKEEINERQKKILKIVIDKYIIENNSISSLTLAKLPELSSWSSSTIRNDMAFLENIGYLEKEYFSSGKIPTKKGYHLYIESLMDDSYWDIKIKEKLVEVFSDRHASIDNVLDKSAKLISEFLNLPIVVVKNFNGGECLKKIDMVNLTDLQYTIFLVTSSGRIIQNMFILDKSYENNKSDLEAALRLLNEGLFDCPINAIQNKLQNLIPVLKNQIHQFELIYETLITQTIIKSFSKVENETPKIYNSKSVFNLPEIQKKEINSEIFFDLLENYSVFFPINKNFSNTGKTLFNLGDERMEGLSVVSTEININLTTHQLSVIGPVRMNYPLIKSLFDFLNEKLSPKRI